MTRHKLLLISVLILFQSQISICSQPPGMYVDGRYLYTASGDTVILKGFNAMIVYWDIHGDINFPEIEKTGANCVRIFWNLDSPRPQPSDLDQVLGNCIAHRMIPIICLWDATGDWEKIQFCLDYWCSAQIVPILQKYEKHLIVNIANEPGNDDMGDTVFRDTYSSAVEQMRTAGLHVPLIIDADRWGRNADAVLDNGQYLLDQDPDHNLIFSWHLWDPKSWMTGTQSEIERIINKAVDKNVCFIVGEFGPCEQCDNCSGTQINWEFLIEKAFHNDIGYLPWVWKWSDCHSIVNNSTGVYGSWVNAPWGENVAVKIEKNNNTWQLLVNGKPLYIKGVVGDSFLEKVKECGGNSVRTGWNQSELDRLDQMGLYALVNLPANAERYGMDYSDTSAVRKQQEALLEIVKMIKNHPAVLMWAIGNELDYIPPLQPFNPKVWDAVNSLARAIHAIDPNHPVMTVIGTSMMEKVAELVKRCPDLDLLGINTYGDIYTLHETLTRYGWTKPYVITEWGPSGYWEVKKTPWGAPYEQTGREKLDCYRDKYLKAIQNDKDQCLGSYVFYWEGFKQETTHTWFCMFDIYGNKSPMVELMCSMWNGRKEIESLPVLDSLKINNQPPQQALYLVAGKEYAARAFCSGSDDTMLSFTWEIRPEAQYAAYAGQGEKEPKPLPGLEKEKKPNVLFIAPSVKGAYRLFVYVYDGNNHFSTANTPFFVE